MLIRCMFCDDLLAMGDDAVKIEVGDFVTEEHFAEGCFPDGDRTKWAHARCLEERFSSVGDAEDNIHCPYCRCEVTEAAFAFTLGIVRRGRFMSQRRPVFVCALCGIDCMGRGRTEEAEKLLGFQNPAWLDQC